LLLIDQNTRNKMIAGAFICAYAVGASKIYIALRYEYRNMKEEIEKTVNDFKYYHP